jgi:phosphoenolpyruvate carboxykinase (GTP)
MTTGIYLPPQKAHKRFKNPKLADFIKDAVDLYQPRDVYVCDGSDGEYDRLCAQMVESGTLIKLNEELRPGSFLARSDPDDVARVEDRTFICSKDRADAGAINRWWHEDEAEATLRGLYRGSMRGRTMYVMAYAMAPMDSPLCLLGVQVSDVPYVCASNQLMTRMGAVPLAEIERGKDFIECWHSVGAPLAEGEQDVPWPCNPIKYICHFRNPYKVMSFGSGYGGNAILPKKCVSLRIADCIAHDNGWLVGHMLILGLESPRGEKIYVVAAFPSACGKTSLAMLKPPPQFADWKVTTIGDDIAWLYVGDDGRLWALNPEYGYFGVAPGTSMATNPNAMAAISHRALFTNVALREEGDIWWEGMTAEPPASLTDWRGQPWTPGCGRTAAHANARFTCRTSQCPARDPEWDNPRGVPISAIWYGGRRSDTMPLIVEARSWDEGIYMGAMLSSETTAAAVGKLGVVRRDSMAMAPFGGRDMGYIFQDWIDIGRRLTNPPKIFVVNWFRKDERGKFRWPGYGDTIRVLKYVFGRYEGTAGAVESALGFMPRYEDIDLTGLDISREQFAALMAVNPDEWRREMALQAEYFDLIGNSMPSELWIRRRQLEAAFGVTA